eukprot:574279_1
MAECEYSSSEEELDKDVKQQPPPVQKSRQPCPNKNGYSDKANSNERTNNTQFRSDPISTNNICDNAYGDYVYSEEEKEETIPNATIWDEPEDKHDASQEDSQDTPPPDNPRRYDHRYHKQTSGCMNTKRAPQSKGKMQGNTDVPRKYPKLFHMTFKQNHWNPWDPKNAKDKRLFGIVNKTGGPGIGSDKPNITDRTNRDNFNYNQNNSNNSNRALVNGQPNNNQNHCLRQKSQNTFCSQDCRST